MEEIVKNLTPMNRCLLGEGYDNALEYIKHLISLEVIEIPSGTQLGTWTVPDEWIIRDARLTAPDGTVLADYKKEPMSLVVGSVPFNGTVKLDDLKLHLHYSETRPNAVPYVYKLYDKDWGFCLKMNDVTEANTEPMAGVKTQDGKEFIPKRKYKLVEGDYKVEIDSEYKPGKMKLGVHTIKGETDREILLFAHLDHPFQANDNISAVACLIDLATRLKSKHTIKIVFCPETIGSIGYALTQDLSKVEFMIAVDICGNKGPILMQKSFKEHKINAIAHLALHANAQSYNKGAFRATIGSDEYVFNDPQIGIPGIMLSRHPYPEYHTTDDNVSMIDYDMIKEMGKVIETIIEYWDKDYTPKKNFKGQLMRSKYGIQSPNPQVNLSWDYLVYAIDGKTSLAELCASYGLNFEFVYKVFDKMIENNEISRIDNRQGAKQKTTRKKSKGA